MWAHLKSLQEPWDGARTGDGRPSWGCGQGDLAGKRQGEPPRPSVSEAQLQPFHSPERPGLGPRAPGLRAFLAGRPGVGPGRPQLQEGSSVLGVWQPPGLVQLRLRCEPSAVTFICLQQGCGGPSRCQEGGRGRGSPLAACAGARPLLVLGPGSHPFIVGLCCEPMASQAFGPKDSGGPRRHCAPQAVRGPTPTCCVDNPQGVLLVPLC